MATSITWNNFTLGSDTDKSFPAPMIAISKEYVRDGAGKVIGMTQNISLEGTIFDAVNSGIDHLVSKESDLRSAFTSTTGCLLSINACSNLSFDNCVVSKYSANKSADNWTKTIDYNIDIISYGNGIDFDEICDSKFRVSSIEDSWNIETIEENSFTDSTIFLSRLGFKSDIPTSTIFPLYRITRTVGAVGIGVCNKSAVEEASKWVNCTINDRGIKSNSIANGLNIFNSSKSISASEIEGSYKTTYNWLASASTANYIETFNIETSIDSSLLRTVTIQGNIKGLEKVDNNFNNTTLYPTDMKDNISGVIKFPTKISTTINNKYENAQKAYDTIKFSMYNRADSARKTDEPQLHTIPVSISEGWNPVEGSISYNYQYNNRPPNFIPNSISETFTVVHQDPIEEFSKIFVIGRKMGPIIRKIGTYSIGSKRAMFEAILPRTSNIQQTPFPASVYSAIEALIDSQSPSSELGYYIKDNTTDWSITDGRFTRSKTWEWTIC